MKTTHMALVKTTYTKEKAAAKATIRYIQHRPGKDGAHIARTLVGSDGVMSRHDAYRMIDAAAEGMYFYRIIISPDPQKEDTHKDIYLRELTEQTILHLTERFRTPILYIASEHTDHTENRHVHALALLPKTLRKPDLVQLRSVATQAALLQRTGQDKAREEREREEEEEQEWDW